MTTWRTLADVAQVMVEIAQTSTTFGWFGQQWAHFEFRPTAAKLSGNWGNTWAQTHPTSVQVGQMCANLGQQNLSENGKLVKPTFTGKLTM